MVWHPRTEQIYAEDFINSSLYEVMFDYVIVSELDNRCWPKVTIIYIYNMMISTKRITIRAIIGL